MRTYILAIVVGLLSLNGILAQSPSQDQNYIMNITYRNGYLEGQETNATNSEKIATIQYLDGLGRAIQTVGVRAGGSSQDMITHIMYDAVGRQTKEYLPYAATTNSGAYRTNALSATNSFYDASKYEADFPGMTTSTINPYSEKFFESSPLDRVWEQTAPGKSWKVGTVIDSEGHSDGHSIKFGYNTNSGTEVKYYIASTVMPGDVFIPSLVLSGSYGAGELNKSVTKDENWKKTQTYLNDHTTEEFKDKQGRVVLKRTYVSNAKYDTYYVYDGFGNLTYVLPPKAEANTDKPNTTELNELCYQYKYDVRNRLVEKKIPGKDWEYIVYDNLDRPVLTQDGMRRMANNTSLSTDEWLFTKYDALGRVAYTGIYSSNSTRSSLQTTFSNKTAAQNYETKVTSGTGYWGTYYTNGDFPSSNISILTINYYDDYNFNRAGTGTSVTAYGVSSVANPRGLQTGSRVRILGEDLFITSVNYYDGKGRPFYTFSFDDYLNTTDIVENNLDFTGKPIETKTTHKRTGKTDIVTIDLFTYDHMDRPVQQTQAINGDTTPEVIVNNTYDELGQLITKGVGGSTSQNRLQTVNYTYNVRGWLKGINNTGGSNSTISLGTGDLFGFQINYDNPSSGTALYNGNISQTYWKTANLDNSVKNYKYTYDALNRITSATDNTGNYNLTSIAYDKNGNIEALSRKGHTAMSGSTVTAYGVMDNLVYTYETNSNKLKKVLDNANDSYGFNDGADQVTEYTYDMNANMLTDANKGISNVIYNHLNLPTTVTINGQNISYIYDALGVKLRKTVNSTTTDYAGNYIYTNGVLEFFNTPEGYVYPVNSSNYSSGFNYVYQYKDHLGNIRLSYSDGNGNGSIQSGSTYTEIIKENNYYPFGLTHKGYNEGGNTAIGNTAALRWRYNNKELQDEDINGKTLDWYDFGARNYDATLGRWMNIDPLAEKMRRHSPYNYVFNNPIYWIDPDGMGATDDYFNKQGKYLGSDNANTDNVRVIEQKTWDDNKTVNDEGIESINHKIGNENSVAFSESDLQTQEQLNVYQHYNPTDLTLKPNFNAEKGGAEFRVSEIGDKYMEIYTEGNKKGTKIADDANAIKSKFVHEKNHYETYKKSGYEVISNPSNLNSLEQMAVRAQINDPTFAKTSEAFQKDQLKYGRKFGLIPVNTRIIGVKLNDLNIKPIKL